jgi:hypothetical protein
VWAASAARPASPGNATPTGSTYRLGTALASSGTLVVDGNVGLKGTVAGLTLTDSTTSRGDWFEGDLYITNTTDGLRRLVFGTLKGAATLGDVAITVDPDMDARLTVFVASSAQTGKGAALGVRLGRVWDASPAEHQVHLPDELGPLGQGHALAPRLVRVRLPSPPAVAGWPRRVCDIYTRSLPR